MVDIDDPTAVISIAGTFAGALSVMTDQVGTAVDALTVDSGEQSALDRQMTGTLNWVRDTFAQAVTAVTEQSDLTARATDYGATKLGNADIDGAASVRSVSI